MRVHDDIGGCLAQHGARGTGEHDVLPSRSRGYWATVRRNLRRDPRAIGSGLILLLLMIGVVGAP